MKSENSRTVLVTGAGGYIGRHVVKALQKKNTEVIALDCCEMPCDDNIKQIVADIFSPDFDVLDYLSELPSTCLHLAWRNGFQHDAPSHMEDLSSHYRFLVNLINKGIDQIAVMGTMHEVGYWEGVVSEETPCNPSSLYAISKDALRRSLFQYTKEKTTKLQWLRGFYVFGNDDVSESIFSKIKRSAAQGVEVFPFTSGKNKYDFLSVEDLSEQISACVMQDKINGIINCCSGKPVSLSEQVNAFIKQNCLDITLRYGAYPDRPYDSPAIWGDDTKIREIMKRA